MRIPSGVTDQYIYFYAVDGTDFTTPEDGLSSFTVYRSRNGAAAAAFTTPTVNETDSVNMAGVYELLLDEDMAIDAGDDEQEMVFHISHAGMAPVVRTITLFRAKITVGNTLTASANGEGNADITFVHGTALTESVGGYLAGGFKKFFDVSTPTGTVNSLPDAVPDVAGGLPISDLGGLDMDTMAAEITAIPTTAMRGTDSAAPASVFVGITLLAEWLGLMAGDQAADATALAEIKATGAGSGQYDEATDSQEAIAGAGGGGAPTVEQITADMDANSTQLAAIVLDTGTTLPAQIDRNADLGESRRGYHTWQGNVFYVDPVNGSDIAAGSRVAPRATIQSVHDDLVTDSNHDVIILVPGHASTVTTHDSGAAATTISKRYCFIRGPGRDFICTRTGNGPTFTVTADGVELSGFQLGSPGASATSIGVAITTSDFVRVHHVWVLDTQGDGIHISRGSNCKIHDCNFEGTGIAAAGQGVHISGAGGAGNANDNEIFDCHFADTAGTAILIDDGTTEDTSIHDNSIHNAGGWGIDITASSVDAQVHNNIMGNNTSGNIQDGGTTSILKNNTQWLDSTVEGRSLDVTAAGEAGIDLDNTSGTLDAAQIGADAITNAKIADGALAAEQFAADALVAATFATGAFTADAFAADALVAATFATGAFTADAFAADALIAATFATGAFTADAFAADALVAATFATGAFTADAFAADALIAATFATDSIAADALAADAVTEIQSGLATTTELDKVPKSDGTVTWNATALGSVNAQMVDVIRTDTVSELAAVPGASPSLHAMVQWVFMSARNKLTSTATASTIGNDAGTAVGTSTDSDDATTFTRGEFS